MTMRSFTKWLLVPAAVMMAACGGSDKPADDGLKNDLALASQMQPYQPQQFMSPTEAGLTANGYQNGQYPNPQAQGAYPQQAQPVYYPQPRPRATVRRVPTSTSSGRTRSSSGGVYSSPAPVRREPVRNTRRDAAIGAVAGGVLGAVTSRDKVKGAVIGAVAGGVLGGIIGHTVDVKQPQY